MQIAFIHAFAGDHDHDHDRDRDNHYNNSRGYDRGHSYAPRVENRGRDFGIRRDVPYRHFDNHAFYHNDYAFRPAFRPEVRIGFPVYHPAWVPLVNFSFGTTYPYGYAYQSDFERILVAINSQAYDDSKLTVAKQAIQNRSLTSNEVQTIMRRFAYDDTRLQFAELAYDHVVDPQNFYSVNSAFAYSGSVDELNNYLNGQQPNSNETH